MGFGGPYAVLWGADTTAPAARINLVRGQSIASAERRGVRLRLTMSEPGTSSLTLTLGGRPPARKTVAFTAAGTQAVTLELSHAARVKLRRRSKVRMTLRAVVADSAHNAATVTRSFALRR